jgi:GNAT superfamily N-acetyltransferase
MAACRAELTVHPGELVPRRTRVAEEGGRAVGFVTVEGQPPVGEIGALFVDPGHIGGGVGRRLLEAALAVARACGFVALDVDSDPHAEAFYLRLGARRTGVAPSASIPGRLLPRLRVDVDPGGSRQPAP